MSPQNAEAMRLKVETIVERDGFTHAIKALGVSREALARFLGRLPVRAGTIALIALNLPTAPRKKGGAK